MNTILEWRDLDVQNRHPFEQDGSLNDLFADASFVQYDGFAPILQTVAVQPSGLLLSFTFDDGALDVAVGSGSCVSGGSVVIRSHGRYYGRLVLGPGVENLIQQIGTSITVNNAFNGATVRSIPTASGLFAVNSFHGAVVLGTDYINRLQVSGNNVTWSAVSLPTDVQTITFNPTSLYLISENGILAELAAGSASPVVLAELPGKYTSLLVVGQRIVAVKGKNIYDISSLPPQLLVTLPDNVNSLTHDSSSIIAVSTSKAYYLPINAPTSYASKNLQHPSTRGAITTATGLLTTTKINASVSELLYLNTGSGGTLSATVNGLFTVDGNVTQPPIDGLATISSTTYGLYSDSGSTTIFTINPELGAGTVATAFANDPVIGKYVGISGGSSASLSVNKMTPLKTINSVAPVSNTITLATGDILTIQQTAQDELTISLAPAISDTNVTRSAQYG
jgi:hypothetical protein